MRAVIGAVASLDGSPVDREEIASLAGRARLPWGGRARIWAGDEIGQLWIPARPVADGPAAGGKRLRFESGRYTAVLDGTLDNRSELASELGLECDPTDPPRPEEVVVAAYERWGVDSAARLVGELAVILWDARERTVFALRDAFGCRELFYRRRENRLLIASQLQMLVERPAPSDVDEDYVADFLAKQFFYTARTPIRSVRRLQSAHWLTFAAGQLTTQRYWSLPDRDHDLPDDVDSAESFLELLREGVERCLLTDGRTWAELSGGLDSSSIVCLAHEILQQRPDRLRDFGTLTMTYHSTPQSDEREWSRAVVERTGIRNVEVPCDDRFFEGMEEASLYRNEPHFGILCHPMFEAEAKALHEAGVDSVLSGARAESVVLSDSVPPVHLADHLRALRFGSFLRELRRWQRGMKQPLLNLALRFGLWPLLRPRLFYSSPEDKGGVDAWVDRDFARRMELGARAQRGHLTERFSSRARQVVAEGLARSEQMVARGLGDWAFEMRHPFLHRPLVERAMEIPWEQKVSPDENKPLLRRAMEGRMPEPVRTRRGTRGPGPAGYKAYAARWSAIEPVVSSSLLVEMGYLDRAEFTKAAELVRFGAATRFGAFTSCLAFEYWLRTLVEPSVEAPAVETSSELP
ncbi:MAG: asparagine synthetase B family protein [Thermoanaerobaculia bacterium]